MKQVDDRPVLNGGRPVEWRLFFGDLSSSAIVVHIHIVNAISFQVLHLL